MLSKWVQGIAFVVVLTGVSMLWVSADQPAHASQPVIVADQAVASLVAVPGDEATYVGSKKCKMCHMDIFKGWGETAHAKALDPLKPGERAEAKTKAGLDPKMDYTTEGKCLACHVVGWEKDGGYKLTGDEKADAKVVESLGGVGCESCHGAGSKYVDVHKAIKKEKREYTHKEMIEAGMTDIDEKTCAGCHNDKSPTFDAAKAPKLDTDSRKGLHPKEELKQRKG